MKISGKITENSKNYEGDAVKKKRILRMLFSFAAYFFGGVLSSISINCFTAPNQMASGGVTGIATVLNYIFSLPIGIGIALLNAPLFILAARKLSREFVFNTIVATAAVSVAVDLLEPILPVYSGDRMLAALFGGLLYGAGIGVILLNRGTTGGTELLGKIIQISKPHVPLGKIMLVIDFAVVAVTTLAYGDLESGLYSLILIFVLTKVVNVMLYGAEGEKAVLIISDKSAAIAAGVMQEIGRGATIFEATGAFTGEKRPALLCAVEQDEFSKLRNIISQTDANAFVIAVPSSQTFGNGFSPIK